MQPGQSRTTVSQLAFETGLSVQNVRTSLSKLKSTNEITIKSTNRNTIISINNWIDHQQTNKPINNQLTNNQQTTNKPTSGLKNVKNVKNDKKGEEEEITKSSIKYLEDVETIKDIANEYSISLKSALFVRDNLVGWCKENGKKKKNYRATLQNWIRRDLQKGNIKKIVINQKPKDLPAITDKQRAMNLKKINEIKNKFKVGK